MKIVNLKTNHITNPLGFDLGKPSLSFITCETTASKQVAAQIEVALDKNFSEVVFNSGRSEEIDSLAFELPIKLETRTRYYWRVTVWGDNGDTATSEVAWFETAKIDEAWDGKWITPDWDNKIHPIISKEFNIEKVIKSARVYTSGLGLYEMNINNKKVGDEYLSPNFNAYDKWIQYQTYDITDVLVQGENKVDVALGNGLYKGRFGFNSVENIYGEKFALICEIIVDFEDGSNLIINSDETWKARKSKVLEGNIYDGEIYDSTFEDTSIYNVKEIGLGVDKLKARLSLPVKIKEKLKPVQILKAPEGEIVLDFGQNMVGWVEFKTKAPKGSEITLQYGEILQEGNFYRDNLRTAKAEYKYIANGEEVTVRPYFTFYGFRYVKVDGWYGEINVDDFTGCVLYSDMEVTGHIETSNPLVNRLFLNALWGQKGNFLDIPTDCPQRDERMGWTGDAQVFSGTACFNMDTFAFFSKYGYDLGREQEKTNGMVPMVVPAAGLPGGGSSAWADAATIIPWNVYVQYGDKKILEQQFESMKAWVDFVKKADDDSGSKRLWTTGFHFGDWLALDGTDPAFPTGGTDIPFISSAYYCYSSMLVAKAAKVLGKEEIAKEYEKLSNEVREAIRDEYFSKNGRMTINTQTALIIALFMDIAPEEKRERVANDLREKLKKDKNHLKTGFVGTPYFCKVLSENGSNDLAYTLLLNKDYPSWLYAVTMGATTIWERWHSVLSDGKISGTDMNSLNHYAYGSIVEWMYRYMVGINPVEDTPGFRHIKLTPMPDYRLKCAKAIYKSAVGTYESEWKITDEGNLEFKFVIPFNASASLILPNAKLENVKVNSKSLKETKLNASQSSENVIVELISGSYEFAYFPEVPYIKYYGVDVSLGELVSNQAVKNIIEEKLPMIVTEDMLERSGHQTLRELSFAPFSPVTNEILEELDNVLNKIKIDVMI
ncbi:alpha-L-rhamnosidase [Inconstantimicrobium mannanitabidum]|uniref:Alfa-L-rhamnosidase n=1 Tax=Inconstantimicrobium mannanitabidum TaxID=1604901 RepID=A0ACB5RA83_9CLOT|nr:alpha-L-rhamnosidase [Clostridium sp. TW13]GKX65769.1 alfa-L-rhamnosidase [Clostridium sp. TW13]